MKKIIMFIMLFVVIASLIESCGSRSMNAAKIAMRDNQWDKAITNLNEELALTPNNGELHLMLTDCYIQTKNYEKAAIHAIKAQELITDPKLVDKVAFDINNIWVNCYNKGVESLNNYDKTKDKIHFDSSLKFLDIGMSLRPEIISFLRFKGNLYELAKDKKQSNSLFVSYCTKFMATFNEIKTYGIALGVDRKEVLNKIGVTPTSEPSGMIGKDTLKIDKFIVQGKELLLFSKATPGSSSAKVISWNYDLPKKWMPTEKNQLFEIDLYPFQVLAQGFYNDGNKLEALNYIKYITEIDPSNVDYAQSLNSLYFETGKVDEAIKSIEDILKKNPTNKESIRTYGDLLASKNDFDGAIQKYEQALKIDPNYDAVIRNLASAYKNKAAIIQKSESEKYDKDPKYKLKTELFVPILEKSADFFNKSLETKSYNKDVAVMGDLANIYSVLNDKTNLERLIKRMELIDAEVPTEQKEFYLKVLLKAYGELKWSDKMNATIKRLDNK